MGEDHSIKDAIAAIVRQDGGRLLAVLAGLLRNLELAEDSLQDAYASALVHWGRSGMPANPTAWIVQVARRKAIDRLRRAKTARDKQSDLNHLLRLDADAPEQDEDYAIPDERLALIFTCCHPALETNACVALTLRSLCGLSTDEIAKAFLVSRETMAQRLVRAQQKIAKARIPFAVPEPADWQDRLAAVLSVIYLIFNEGYASDSPDYIRVDLTEEAIRLARIVWQLAPAEPEAGGLLALLMLQRSRFGARLDAHGVMVALERQDRKLWDQTLIAEGTRLLQHVLRRGLAGPYQLQAAIAAIHCEAPDFAATDWQEILLIYDRLFALTPNPVVALNRLVAVSYVSGAQAALNELGALEDDLGHYQSFHAVKADLLVRTGELAAASCAYDAAISLSGHEAERRFLMERRTALGSA